MSFGYASAATSRHSLPGDAAGAQGGEGGAAGDAGGAPALQVVTALVPQQMHLDAQACDISNTPADAQVMMSTALWPPAGAQAMVSA